MNARRRNHLAFGVLALALGILPGCGGDSGPADVSGAADHSGPASTGTVAAAAASGDLVERAATIALEIEADPDATERILERHGVSAEEFEEMMMRISEDEDLRRAYNARLGG